MKTAAVRMMVILIVTIVILALFYSGQLFGLTIENLDHFLIVFTAVTLFATVILLSAGGKK